MQFSRTTSDRKLEGKPENELKYNSVKSILGVNTNSMVLVMGCVYPDPSLALTNMLISRSLSGAVLDVALIIFEVWDSDSCFIYTSDQEQGCTPECVGGGGGADDHTAVESQAQNRKNGQHTRTKTNGNTTNTTTRPHGRYTQLYMNRKNESVTCGTTHPHQWQVESVGIYIHVLVSVGH